MMNSRVMYRRILSVAVLFLAAALAFSSLGMAARAAYSAPVTPAVHIVISEFRTRGPGGVSDEFVELYNPTGAPVNISGWSLKRSTSCGPSVENLVTLGAGLPDLQPGQHYLLAASASGVSGLADKTFTAALADEGGIAILDKDGVVIDQVGMCTGTYYREGTALIAQSSTTAGQSYERGPGGIYGSWSDTNDNRTDFALTSSVNPQNYAGAPVLPADPPTATYTASYTLTFTSTDTETPTDTATATATPPPALHIVISEFRTRGSGGTDDEFVELYNPTGGAVNIGGWVIRRSASCGTSVYNLVTITTNTVLQPGQHFLAAATASSVSGADQTFSAAIADDGGVALVNSSGTVVDQAGACDATQYHEGTSLEPLEENADQGYERKPGGSTSCFDTDNNAGDFALVASNPQNKNITSVMCEGVTLYTPTATATATATRTPTVTATFVPGDVVINEFLPHPGSDWNADGRIDVYDEYIELINVGSKSVSIKNWKLDNGVGGSSQAYKLPDITLLPRQIVRFFRSESGVAISDGGSTVRLLRSDGRTADILNYPVVTASDRTWCRLPDGTGVWDFVCQPTPGRLNMQYTPGAEPGGAPRAVLCPLPDAVPASIREAECGQTGIGIFEAASQEQFWLWNLWKWDVFVE